MALPGSSDHAPRLVGLVLPTGGDDLDAIERLWHRGDAVLPLPREATQARRLIDALHPDAVVASDGGGCAQHIGSHGGDDPLPPGTALVVATSGTTGTPRGVVLSHAALDAAVTASLTRVGVDTDDGWLCCLPLVHLAGLLVLLRGRAMRRPAIVHPKFSVDAVAAALERPAPPTHVSLVPTMLQRLLENGLDLSGLQCILLGGAAAPEGLLERARVSGARVVTTYGMTETCGGVVYDGVPLDDVAAAVEPSGRILLASPTLFSGYRDGRSPQLKDGWFTTADHGRWSIDGRLDVHGRLDDMIVTGGENIDPAMVATTLEAHPLVKAAAVRGVPDTEWGHRIEAWVVSWDPAALSLDLLATYARTQLPPPAIPKRLHLVRALPRTALGKIATASLSGASAIRSWPEDDNMP